MKNYWFSSDPHLFHENMFRTFKIPCPRCTATGVEPFSGGLPCKDGCDDGEIPARPFSSIAEMHTCMIDAHNARVTEEDHWTCLGDVTMLRSAASKQLVVNEVHKFRGHKRLILGNHDHFGMDVYRDCGFQKIMGSNRIDNLIFSHWPVERNSIPRGCVNVHGHIHTNPTPPGPYINISMEVINYAPVSLEELKAQARTLLRSLENEEVPQ